MVESTPVDVIISAENKQIGIAAGRKINMIKDLRELIQGMGLIDAKRVIEDTNDTVICTKATQEDGQRYIESLTGTLGQVTLSLRERPNATILDM